ncbi:MAG TPA: 23S rRNA (adenine(2030)-N(6))-methyltransferase RlmJ [Methylococcaceae bacterium]|nr:23S rRNA (adenine(2030)-N(6))-methyltransferase RlmJ [Methylococcaceae bacterium]
MLSYRHSFHAGNFADVLKHAVLVLLLEALQRKDKPFFYLDTHAGAGRYDLNAPAAQKNREFADGIERILSRSDAPPELAGYLAAVRSSQGQGRRLRHYPGSPYIARRHLRPGDRMALTELHPSDFAALRGLFAGDRQVQVENEDGYQAVKALLPPRERRGLVLFDPAFERREENTRLLEALQNAHRRWASGTFALWLPIQSSDTHAAFLRRVRATGIANILQAELTIAPESPLLGLCGTAMLVVNPPWKLDEQLNRLLPWLWQALSRHGLGGWRVEWLAAK